MRLILSAFILLFSYHSLGQDPSCELVITLKNVNVKKYSYKFFTDTEFNKIAINTISSHIKTGKTIGREHTESSLSTAQDGKAIITTYYSDYCYPNPQIRNQLRIQSNKTDESFHSQSGLKSQFHQKSIYLQFC